MAKPSRVLITFLGKGQRSKDRTGYLTATYDFGAGRTEEARFFGIALLRFLSAMRERLPTSLVVLGTTGSDWGMFYEELRLLGDEDALSHAVALDEASRSDRVNDAQVDELRGRVEAALGCPCRFALIPYGDDLEQQTAILHRIAECAGAHPRVTLDLTHGLRHLPMLGLLSALQLRASNRVEVEAVYYGALDLRSRHSQGHAPVLRLDGLLSIAAWTAALQTFDKDADYSVFVPLLRQDGVSEEALRALRQAAFLERTARVGEARSQVERFLTLTSGLATAPGPSALFAADLRERLSWAKAEGHYERQRRLAFLHWEHEDYLRAALAGLEAFIDLLVLERGGQPTSADDRKAALAHFKRSRDRRDRTRAAYEALNAFRNAVVHVDSARGREAAELFKSIETLHGTIGQWLATLLPAKHA